MPGSPRPVLLMVAVEQRFAIRFGTQELAGLKDVGDLLALIAAKQGG